MKKSLLAIGLTVLLFGACKKEEIEEFVATDLTGTAVLSGNITKTILSQNSGFGYQSVNIPAEGVSVSVRILNSQLYPNSPNAQGSEVYSAITDASGNYSITVKTNGNGNVNGTITVNDKIGTRDTIKNGSTITGPNANFNGTTTSRTFIKGVNQVFNHTMSATILVGNPDPIVIGSAIVTGTVLIRHYQEDTISAGNYFYYLDDFALPNHLVTLEFDKDPITQAVRTYTATTDAQGVYSFTVQTTNDPGFTNYATVKINDYYTTRDTVRLNGTTITPGVMGVFEDYTIGVTNLDPTEVRNHQDLYYWIFN